MSRHTYLCFNIDVWFLLVVVSSSLDIFSWLCSCCLCCCRWLSRCAPLFFVTAANVENEREKENKHLWKMLALLYFRSIRKKISFVFLWLISIFFSSIFFFNCRSDFNMHFELWFTYDDMADSDFTYRLNALEYCLILCYCCCYYY